MSLDPPSAAPSPTPDELAALVRLRGAPLLDSLEAHLPGAREHGEASGSYAFAAAVELGLGRVGAELCRETAKLHEIGKLYVPAELLAKPSDLLRPDERAYIAAYHEAGARLALGAGIPDDVCGWLLQVRERYDGRGPERHAGDAIPIASRVARAACLCDSILSAPQAAGEQAAAGERRAAAIARLRDAGGGELDPQVVEAIAAVLQRAA